MKVESVGLYLHLPYCRQKCSYCAFNSYASPGAPPAAYLAALGEQLRLLAAHPWLRERRVATIFIGGGTPTLYDGRSLAALLALCLRLYPLAPEAEISIEANPNSLSLAKLQELREAGVNRLSIGVQSFTPRLLRLLGRVHSRRQAVAAVEWARQAGFANINLDLIYGLPTQTLPEWQESVAAALALAPEHLALYELSLEPGTRLANSVAAGSLAAADEELVADQEELAQAALAGAGYRRYEISNYARPGRECRHNRNYWENGSYLGVGAGAVGCLSGIRIRNVERPEEYIRLSAARRPPYAEAEMLSAAASFRESVIMGLRLLQGVSLAALHQRYGLTPADYYGPILSRLLAQKLLLTSRGRLRLSKRALPVANQVLAELV